MNEFLIEYNSYDEDLLMEMLEEKDKEILIESWIEDPLDLFILD